MMETSSSHPYSCPKTQLWPPSYLQGRNKAITLPNRAMHYGPTPTHKHTHMNTQMKRKACRRYRQTLLSLIQGLPSLSPQGFQQQAANLYHNITVSWHSDSALPFWTGLKLVVRQQERWEGVEGWLAPHIWGLKSIVHKSSIHRCHDSCLLQRAWKWKVERNEYLSALEAIKLKGLSPFFSFRPQIFDGKYRRLALFDRNFEIDWANLRANRCRLVSCDSFMIIPESRA